jgi:hypothetical protein
MKTFRKGTAIALILIAAALIAGCTISSGVFTGMAQSSSDTSLSASYISFDGSVARRVNLKAGDTVTFRLEGGNGLQALVIKSGEELFSIADGAVFTVTEEGSYDFTLKGKAENGSFSLSWAVEKPAGGQ